MSLSTERNAEAVQSGSPPEMLFPMFGKDAKKEAAELKHSYPSSVEGKRQIIDAGTVRDYFYLAAAAAHYEDQYSLMKNRMRFLLGDAEYGVTDAGLIIVQRRFTDVGPVNIPPRTDDSLHLIRN